MDKFETEADANDATKFWDFSLGRVIQAAGTFFGILSGIYLPRWFLPSDAGFWTKLAVGLSVCFTVLAFFRIVGAAISRRA